MIISLCLLQLVEYNPNYQDAYADLYIGTMVGGDNGQTLRKAV
jgi:hypothetical protein